MNELRLYTFTHFQLSSIQQGIQAGHAAVELVNTHGQHGMVQEWADEWKTFVCLNGGNSADLKNLVWMLSSRDNPYPWKIFNESQDAFEGVLTSIAIVLPERIFNGAKMIRTGELMPYMDPPEDPFTPFEWELMLKIASSKMAQ